MVCGNFYDIAWTVFWWFVNFLMIGLGLESDGLWIFYDSAWTGIWWFVNFLMIVLGL